MTVPKSRGTKSKRDKRRLHIFLKKPTVTKCSKCGKMIPPHTACSFCGYYKGRQIIDVLAKLTKREKKEKEKKMKNEEKVAKEKKALNLQKLSKK